MKLIESITDKLLMVKFQKSELIQLRFESLDKVKEFQKFYETLDENNTKDYKLFLNKIIELSDNPKSRDILTEIAKQKIKEEDIYEAVLEHEELSIKNGKLYIDNLNLSVPEIIQYKIIEFTKTGQDLTPIINFWRHLCYNPNPEAIEGAFRFITDLDLKINNHGFFVAYRNVMPLANSIDKEYIKELWIKLSSDKNDYDVANFQLYQIDVNFELFTKYKENNSKKITKSISRSLSTGSLYFLLDSKYDIEYLLDLFNNVEYNSGFSSNSRVLKDFKVYNALNDNLAINPQLASIFETMSDYIKQIKEDVYTKFGTYINYRKQSKNRLYIKTSINNAYHVGNLDNLFKEDVQIFTDNHTKRMKIVLNQPVKMLRSLCDSNPNQSCSAGLHVGSDSFGTGYFGTIKLACLINPSDIVAVPHEYGKGYKMRVCSYMPVKILNVGEKFDNNVPDEIVQRYVKESIDRLKILLKERHIEELTSYNVINKFLTEEDVNKLIDIIESRFIKV